MARPSTHKTCMSEAVLTLIAGAKGIAEWPRVLRTARGALEPLGAHLDPVDWLAVEQAVDLGFEGLDPDQAEAAVRLALGRDIGDLPLDLVAQPREGRPKRLPV